MKVLFEKLDEIEAASGSNAKKEILKDLCKDKNCKEILRRCLDPLFPMYLGRESKFTGIKPDHDEHDTTSFLIVMESLHDGLIPRGSAAHIAVEEAMDSFHPPELCDHDQLEAYKRAVKWIPRLVTKDLQIGVSWETFTKVNGEKKYAVMLAKDINKIKNRDKKFTFPVFVQPKLDGYRATSHPDEGHALKSRNGKRYGNFGEIEAILRRASDPDFGGLLHLDGEIMSDDFQAMQKTAFRQDNKKVGDLKFHVFDGFVRSEWKGRKGVLSFKERFEKIQEVVVEHPQIKIVETHECHSWEEVYIHHADFIAQGYEGTIVRANEPYQFKRTDFLAKIKEMKSMDCEVLSIKEGHNSLIGSMGHLVVKQENGVECGVGSGFTLEDRKLIYECEDLTVGRIAEIKYQELTKDGVMRFPVFMRWRDDLKH